MLDPKDLLAIAQCCRNSATMLRLCEHRDPDEERRKRIMAANAGQAGLLERCAELLEREAEARAPDHV